jgi:hypothetical protein
LGLGRADISKRQSGENAMSVGVSRKNRETATKRIMIVGVGDLGGRCLEYLAHTQAVPEIIAADKDYERCSKRVYNAILGASYMNLYPKINAVKIDLNDVSSTAQTLAQLKPTVIIHTATLASWLMFADVPFELAKKLYYAPEGPGYGPWIALDIPLTYKLMLAVKRSKIQTHVICAPYPDLVNPVLAKIGLAPTIGLGSGDLIVPAIRKRVAEKLRKRIQDVSIRYVAHEVILDQCRVGMLTAPYILRILVNGKDVTTQFDCDRLLIQAYSCTAGGRDIHPLTAWSGVKNALAIVNDTNLLTHVAAPNGLVGGYDARLNAEGAEVVLPEGVDLADAIKINEEGQRQNGVDRIDDDGTIIFTNDSWKKMKELLGYDCRMLKLDECELRAHELIERYKRLSRPA